MLIQPGQQISIHALLAESDDVNNPVFAVTSISIHALLAESDALGLLGWLRVLISIHALLAESDVLVWFSCGGAFDFYPRSPCGERLHLFASSGVDFAISIHALLAESDYLGAWKSCNVRDFYPRSPCGERRVAAPLCRRR